MARRLTRSRSAIAEQEIVFKQLVARLALTAAGRDLAIGAHMTYAEFRGRVPVRDHQQLESYFTRIKRGQPNILWPGTSTWSVESSGTTAKPKWLPVSDELVRHFEAAAHMAMMFYCARIDSTAVFHGRHLSLDTNIPSPAIEGASADTRAELKQPPFLEGPAWGAPHLTEPGATIAKIVDWPAKIDAIIARTLRMDISLLAGMPNWLIAFADQLRTAARGQEIPAATLRSVWPHLECVVHHGIPITPFHEELRRVSGSQVNFHEIYFAAEAFIAAQDADAGSGLRLIDDAGVFFEFIPLAEFNEALPLTLGSKALPLAEVQAGEDYVLLLTTPAGLCRYVLGDIVRFVSAEPPRLIPVGRLGQRLTSFGENLLEKELTDSLVAVCQRHNWTITNFHVAPLFASSLVGHNHGRHEWWVELHPGTAETPTGPIIAAHIDVELQGRSPSYAKKRQTGPIDAPIVRLVMPGFFENWMKQHHRWGGQKKMPRCGPDRTIADEFSAIACFNAD